MGTYQDVAFTFKPDDVPLTAVADALRELLDRPIDDLPMDWNPPDRHRDRDLDRGRLMVETDEEYGQVYLGGRTHPHTLRDAWQTFVVNAGIGDGILAVIEGHEVDLTGKAWLYTWSPDSGEYEPVVYSDLSYGHIPGEDGASGAIAAHRVADEADIKPARYRDRKIIRFEKTGPYGRPFIPERYFETGGEDAVDPRD